MDTINEKASANAQGEATQAVEPAAPIPTDAERVQLVASKPKHVDLGSLKVDYPSTEWVERVEEYVKRISGRMQEAIDAAAEHGRDDYRVHMFSAGAWLAATDLRGMAIERGIHLVKPTQPVIPPDVAKMVEAKSEITKVAAALVNTSPLRTLRPDAGQKTVSIRKVEDASDETFEELRLLAVRLVKVRDALGAAATQARVASEPVGEIVGTEKRGFALMTLVRWEPGFDRTKIGTLLYISPQPSHEPAAQPAGGDAS